MKKKFIYIVLLILCTSFMVGCTRSYSYIQDDNIVYNYDDVKDTLVRFHIIANSDLERDQELKLKVKDKVIGYLYPMLRESNSIKETKNILKDNEDEVLKIVNDVIVKEGYNYKVNIELSKENFPDKIYGNIVLPQGEYEAYRIIIGTGEGQNWWCVMFPPLCFVDVTKGKVEEDTCKEKLDEEIEDKKQVKIKSKIYEVIKDLFN